MPTIEEILDIERLNFEYRRRVRNTTLASFTLHSLLLFAASSYYQNQQFSENHQHSHTKHITKIEVSNGHDEIQGDSSNLPQVIFYDSLPSLGSETQSSSANESKDRLANSVITPNYSLEEKLRDAIITGKSPIDEYRSNSSPGQKDAVDYRTFFLLFLKQYLELKSDFLILSTGNAIANGIDLAIPFTVSIDEGGQVKLLQYGDSKNLNKH